VLLFVRYKRFLYFLTTQESIGARTKSSVGRTQLLHQDHYLWWSKTFECDLKVISKVACVAVNPRKEGVREFGTCTWSCQ